MIVVTISACSPVPGTPGSYPTPLTRRARPIHTSPPDRTQAESSTPSPIFLRRSSSHVESRNYRGRRCRPCPRSRAEHPQICRTGGCIGYRCPGRRVLHRRLRRYPGRRCRCAAGTGRCRRGRLSQLYAPRPFTIGTARRSIGAVRKAARTLSRRGQGNGGGRR
ncbi:Uncharacterised protein [Mycobacteroides abscessus subsp. abscessus]|nr:Uncharacterised protein [Mycobacteroides abscessus subsp. abscessus]